MQEIHIAVQLIVLRTQQDILFKSNISDLTGSFLLCRNSVRHISCTVMTMTIMTIFGVVSSSRPGTGHTHLWKRNTYNTLGPHLNRIEATVNSKLARLFESYSRLTGVWNSIFMLCSAFQEKFSCLQNDLPYFERFKLYLATYGITYSGLLY